MKDVQLRRTSDGQQLRLGPPVAPPDTEPPWSDTLFYLGSAGFSLTHGCAMTVINKQDFKERTVGVAGFGWAVSLEGETTAPTESVAGAQHRYVFPRIATLSFPAEILNIGSVAAESVVSITPKDLPADYVSTGSSPAVEDPIAPMWSLPLHSANGVPGFELYGVDQRHEAGVQRDLFFASASAGTAGGGLIWFFGAAGPFVDSFLRKFRRREAPLVEERDEPKPSPASKGDAGDSPTYYQLVVACLLSGTAGSMLAWLVSRRRSKRKVAPSSTKDH